MYFIAQTIKDHIEMIENRFSFMRSIFPKLDENIFESFVYGLKQEVHLNYHTIYPQGATPDNLYLVKEGQVELWEQVGFEELAKEERDRITLKPIQAFDRRRKTVRSSKVSVSLVTSMQFFGEEVLLGKEHRAYSALTKSANTVIYSFPKRLIVILNEFYPSFIEYLKTQFGTSFESKQHRSENLKTELEKEISMPVQVSKISSWKIEDANAWKNTMDSEYYINMSPVMNNTNEELHRKTLLFADCFMSPPRKISTERDRSPLHKKLENKMNELKMNMLSGGKSKMRVVNPNALTERRDDGTPEGRNANKSLIY